MLTVLVDANEEGLVCLFIPPGTGRLPISRRWGDGNVPVTSCWIDAVLLPTVEWDAASFQYKDEKTCF